MDGEVTHVYSSLAKLAYSLIVGVLLVGFGILLGGVASHFLVIEEAIRAALIGLFGVGMVWLGADAVLVATKSLSSSEPWLTLSPDGLCVRGWDRGVVRWKDIESIEEVEEHHGKARRWCLHVRLRAESMPSLSQTSESQRNVGGIPLEGEGVTFRLDNSEVPISLEELHALLRLYLENPGSA